MLACSKPAAFSLTFILPSSKAPAMELTQELSRRRCSGTCLRVTTSEAAKQLHLCAPKPRTRGAVDLRRTPLQPLLPPEEHIRTNRRESHEYDRQGIAPSPIELRHHFEVHAVDRGDDGLCYE